MGILAIQRERERERERSARPFYLVQWFLGPIFMYVCGLQPCTAPSGDVPAFISFLFILFLFLFFLLIRGRKGD